MMIITALTHPPPPQSRCAGVTRYVLHNGVTVLGVCDVTQDFSGFLRFDDLTTNFRLRSVWLVIPTGRRFKAMVHSVFLKSVNAKQGVILLVDKTIAGCVIAKVVNEGLTPAQRD